MPPITVKRVYDPIEKNEGARVLVDRIWPRGITKEQLQADHWLRDVAPSNQLRKWFAHDLARWEEFKLRYTEELQSNPEPIRFLLELAQEKGLVLLFAAKDVQHNQAIVLKDYLLSVTNTPRADAQAVRSLRPAA